ncbi:hypothetical protein MCSV2_20010 [Mucispirillum schaedleri ASF457]|nr:hypothetical protein MCSV2_20010 [Mucispirillum schaedleri ASF457]
MIGILIYKLSGYLVGWSCTGATGWIGSLFSTLKNGRDAYGI